MADWAGLGAAPDAVGLLLTEAAQRLADAGWVQGRFRGPDGQMDAVQAVASVAGLDLAESSRREKRLPVGGCVLLGAALERVCARLGCAHLSVWNDDPERTIAEVVAALEGA